MVTRSNARAVKTAFTFQRLVLIGLSILVFLQMVNMHRANNSLCSVSPTQVSHIPEQNLPPTQQRIIDFSEANILNELNTTRSSLTQRSFFYKSNSSTKVVDGDFFWKFEEIKVYSSNDDLMSTAFDHNGNNSADHSSNWSPVDIQIWCPQPFLSILESPKLVKAKDYQDSATYPRSYANKDYLAEIRQWQTFSVPSVNSSLVKAESQNNVNAAVCRLNPTREFSPHFPHAMEEIYVCIDYWINAGADKKPVFLYDQTRKEVMEAWENNAFMKGILAILKEEMGVVVMTTEDYLQCATFDSNNRGKNKTNFIATETAQQIEVCESIYHPNQTIRTRNKFGNQYFFLRATEFNTYVDSFLRKNAKIKNENSSSSSSSTTTKNTKTKTNLRDERVSVDDHFCAKPPRIGILNRESSRGIVNADRLADDLSELQYVYRNGASSTTREFVAAPPVELIFFENLSFVEQVEFFRRTDIVVSGHGAQLTGVPFLKANSDSGHCKQVFELFPNNYVIPSFFGTLVVGSKMSHSYVYYDDGLEPVMGDANHASSTGPLFRTHPLRKVLPWETQVATDYSERVTARMANFCPRRDDMVDYLSELIFDWYRCHGC